MAILNERKRRPKLIVILGPTSSGKTALAVGLAKKINGEIVSADSRQVYKGMDIGTGKDLKIYKKTRVPYHLIDIISPKRQFNISDFQKKAYQSIDDILLRGKIPFLVGGSGLYINAIALGYNMPEIKMNIKFRAILAKKTLLQLQNLVKRRNINLNKSDFSNKRRLIRKIEARKNITIAKNSPKYDCLIIGLNPSKKTLHKKIEQRLRRRIIKDGLVSEVKKLYQHGLTWKRLDDFGLEYRFTAKYLRKEFTKEEFIQKLAIAIKQFARRQMTWFLGQAKKNKQTIHWIKSKTLAEKLIKNFLNQ